MAKELKTEKRNIGTGGSCFLIKDKRLLTDYVSPVYKWLWDHDFVASGKKGVLQGVDWVFVNLYSKVFSHSLSGRTATSIVCNHAVSFEEFEVIYNIFKKYEGLGVMNMTEEEQEEYDKYLNANKEEERKYVSELTYEKFFNEVKEELADYLKQRNLAEGELIAYMKKEEQEIIKAYETNKRLFTDKAEEGDCLCGAWYVACYLDCLYSKNEDKVISED